MGAASSVFVGEEVFVGEGVLSDSVFASCSFEEVASTESGAEISPKVELLLFSGAEVELKLGLARDEFRAVFFLAGVFSDAEAVEIVSVGECV